MSIRTIAALANVSTSTVSRVLNNHPYVSADKRQRVLSIMEEIDYVPNKNAINLSNGDSGVIGLIIPYNRNSCYDQLLESILKEASRVNKKVMILPTYYDQQLERNYFRMLRDKTLDGIIVTSKTQDDSFLEELIQFGPIVTTERTNHQMIPSTYPDRSYMYRAVFQHLSDHVIFSKIIVTVNRKSEHSLSSKQKIAQFSAIFPDLNADDVFYYGFSDFSDGYRFGKEMFKTDPNDIAIYANGDEVAAGIYQAAIESNKQLNKDFFLIGEDNLPYSLVLSFSTVDFNLQQVGCDSVALLLDRTIKHEAVVGKLIIR